MATALQTGTGIGSSALGAVLPLLGVSNPVSAALAGAVGLVGLVQSIGAGRKTANSMTENGGPQDVLNKQLAAISGSTADPNEKAQATQVAWGQFLQAANQFAQTKGVKAPQVVQQAIYKTPGLTDTVSNLLKPLGVTAFDPSFTSLVPGITATNDVNQSAVPVGSIIGTGLGVAAPFIESGLGLTGGNGSGGSGNTSVSDGGPTFGPDVPPDVTSGV